MNACLSERALLAVYANDASAVERAHLQRCAACGERYGALTHDLNLIDTVLSAPPPRGLTVNHRSFRRPVWVLAAAAVSAALAVLVVAAWLQTPPPVEVAVREPGVAGFAADVSAAIFAGAEEEVTPGSAEPPYLRAALDVGSPCTTDEFFRGECSDQISVLFLEGE